MYTAKIEVDVVINAEHGKVVIQCLQYDICAQGDDFEEAKKSFQFLFAGESVINLFREIPPAPKEYWDLPKTKLKITIGTDFE